MDLLIHSNVEVGGPINPLVDDDIMTDPAGCSVNVTDRIAGTREVID